MKNTRYFAYKNKTSYTDLEHQYQIYLLLYIVDIKCIYQMNRIVQGVPKGTDTFQPLIIKKPDNLRFFLITKTSIKCHFFNIFGKTVNLNFNGLTGVN